MSGFGGRLPFYTVTNPNKATDLTTAYVAAKMLIDTTPASIAYTYSDGSMTSVSFDGYKQEIRRSGGVITSIGGVQVDSTFTRGGVAAAPVFQTEGSYTGVLVRDAATSGTSAEALTLPTVSVLNPLEGAVVTLVYADGDAVSATPTSNHYTFAVTAGPSYTDLFGARTSVTTGYPTAFFNGVSQSIAGSAKLTLGWHVIGIRWSAARLSLYVDGVEVASKVSPTMPASFNGTMSIGRLDSTGGHWNYPIGGFLVEYEAPTDAEMVEYTTLATFPTAPTAKTSLYLPLDSDLLNVARVVDLTYTGGELTGMDLTTETLG